MVIWCIFLFTVRYLKISSNLSGARGGEIKFTYNYWNNISDSLKWTSQKLQIFHFSLFLFRSTPLHKMKHNVFTHEYKFEEKNDALPVFCRFKSTFTYLFGLHFESLMYWLNLNMFPCNERKMILWKYFVINKSIHESVHRQTEYICGQFNQSIFICYSNNIHCTTVFNAL